LPRHFQWNPVRAQAREIIERTEIAVAISCHMTGGNRLIGFRINLSKLIHKLDSNMTKYLPKPSRTLALTLFVTASFTVIDSGSAQSYLIDFGRNDSGVNGQPTASPDVNGNYWNNMGLSSDAQPLNYGIENLVSTTGDLSTITLTTITSTWRANGILNGGLPNPNPALLGDFAVGTATEDYFYIQDFNDGHGATATLQIGGLNPLLTYDLSMFGTRNTTQIRGTQYLVTDINGNHSVTLQTSGAGSGSDAYPNGNDDTIVSLTGLVPDASGNLNLIASETVSGTYAYLGILEITAVPEPGTIALAGVGVVMLFFARRRAHEA
jgi:hypothetical protein